MALVCKGMKFPGPFIEMALMRVGDSAEGVCIERAVRPKPPFPLDWIIRFFGAVIVKVGGCCCCTV